MFSFGYIFFYIQVIDKDKKNHDFLLTVNERVQPYQFVHTPKLMILTCIQNVCTVPETPNIKKCFILFNSYTRQCEIEDNKFSQVWTNVIALGFY